MINDRSPDPQELKISEWPSWPLSLFLIRLGGGWKSRDLPNLASQHVQGKAPCQTEAHLPSAGHFHH